MLTGACCYEILYRFSINCVPPYADVGNVLGESVAATLFWLQAGTAPGVSRVLPQPDSACDRASGLGQRRVLPGELGACAAGLIWRTCAGDVITSPLRHTIKGAGRTRSHDSGWVAVPFGYVLPHGVPS